MSEKIRLLLVDDHAVLRTGLRMFFNSQEDMEAVGEAVSAEDAFEKLLSLKPDIVLLDISLPGISGVEAIARIKELAPNVRVLMLTMHEGEEYLQQALQAGAQGYVVKKAADTELLEAVRAVAKNDIFVHPSMAQTLIRSLYTKEVNKSNKRNVNLTEREKEVLKLVALGHTNKEISERLSVSVKTVETHKAKIMEKTGCERRSELVRFAMQHGYI